MLCQPLYLQGHSLDSQGALFSSPQAHGLSINTEIHGDAFSINGLSWQSQKEKCSKEEDLPHSGNPTGTQVLRIVPGEAITVTSEQVQGHPGDPLSRQPTETYSVCQGVFLRGAMALPFRVLSDDSPVTLKSSITMGLTCLF